MNNNDKPFIEEKIKNLICDKLGGRPEDMKIDDSLDDDIGADSLDTLEIKIEVESYFRISIEDDELERWRTLGDIVDYVDSVLNPIGV